jgi:endonuclease YncB( thermonuclease family)
MSTQPSSRFPSRALALAAVAALLCAACGADSRSSRYSRDQAQASLASIESPGVVMGEFTLARNGVVDGDTIRVQGLDTTLRLLAIDTEENFWREKERRAFESMSWEDYIASEHAKSKRPSRVATPMGEEASAWAKQWFAGTRTVRLERDHPKDIRDRFNRYLAYVFAEKDGVWVNYNVEAVRAGMTPYYTKYGYSRRFHDEFVAAENEARAAGRGIWDPTKQAYGDYDERRQWWDARADFVREFEKEAYGRDDYVMLSHWDSLRSLEALVGQEATVLGTITRIRLGDTGPTQVLLARRMFSDFPLVFFDKDVYLATGIGKYRGEFVKVRGVVNKYRNRHTNRDTLQILVNLPSQVVTPVVPGIDDPRSTDSP